MTTLTHHHVENKLAQAVSLHTAGHMQEATQLYREVLLEHPHQPNASYHLGVIALEDHHIEDSLPLFKNALEADPQEAKYWVGYIHALIQATHYDDAKLVLSYGVEAGLAGQEVDVLTDTLEKLLWGTNSALPYVKQANDLIATATHVPPPSVEAELITLFENLRYEDVENKILALVGQYPNWLVGWKILSDTLLIQGKDARLAALRALALNPNDAKEHCYYGLVLKSHGDLVGAAAQFEQAIQLKPDYAAAYNNLGIVKKDAGDVEAGIQNYQRALALNPNYASCYSNLLFCQTHSEHVDAKALFEAHRAFSKQYESTLQKSWVKHSNSRDTERTLRVGLVSSDFKDHSLAYFIAPLLKHLSVSLNLSLYAYANNALEDSTTQDLRAYFRFWNQVSGLSDAQLSAKIKDDGIDILVDLDGHTSDNRLLTFAMKPAPIQVSWLGYLSTTGLTAIDYYFADSYLTPPSKLDGQFTEKLVQLPANAPFMPSEVAPEVNALPALKNSYITFACFNRPNKITQSVVRLWAKLLNALPTSKMLLGAMPKDGSYDTMIAWFEAAGITQDRLIFHPRSTIENYLNLHHEVDFCLDTFPSNGVTTTCHAVWMGIPTLCLEGNSLASRGALAVMKHVGLDCFIAANEADFVQQGLHWAYHLDDLVEVRDSLRERFKASALAKPEIIAKGVEQAFRQMWRRWCKKLPIESFEVLSD